MNITLIWLNFELLSVPAIPKLGWKVVFSLPLLRKSTRVSKIVLKEDAFYRKTAVSKHNNK